MLIANFSVQFLEFEKSSYIFFMSKLLGIDEKKTLIELKPSIILQLVLLNLILGGFRRSSNITNKYGTFCR